MKIKFRKPGVVIFYQLLLSFGILHAQVTSPLEHFGFEIGANYHLTNYTQTESYFQKIAEQSNRILLQELGKTEEGRSQYMLVVSSPDNLNKVHRYQEISRHLALAEMPEDIARDMAKEGKAVVWIDGGLHSTETVATHQLIETLYQVVSGQSEEIQNILDKVIILFVHANPDGHELIGNWYMQERVPEKRTMGRPPLMYHKYVGHDNNRDFFMFNMAESRNMAKPLFVDWIPQIVYNHHQSAPAGTVVVGPPYRDPFNYVYDPILVTSLDALGAAMHTRLNVEGKPGYGQRGASRFSTWWNGGLRTSVYFHNMIGILTEIIGGPNPSEIPLYLNRILPNGDSPNPIHPQPWNFKKSIDYSVSLNMAVLHYAAKNKEDLLFNIYKMGQNSIAKGSQPSLSISPRQVSYMQDKAGDTVGRRISEKWYQELAENLDRRDPVAYLIPTDQPDFATAIKFLNRLIIAGITVEKAEASFEYGGKVYPKGSYVVPLSQAFRAHILDMFEPQDHPNDFEFEGGPPIPPYDAAGWTLAYTMGVKFESVRTALPELPTVKIPRGELIKYEAPAVPAAKYLAFSPEVNDNFKVVNRLMKAGVEVFKSKRGVFYVENIPKHRAEIDETYSAMPSSIQGVSALPTDVAKVKKKRIALWDNYGGTMKSGWMRWLLEDFGYDYEVVFNPDIDKGGLKEKYDIIIFAGGGIGKKLKNYNAEALSFDDRAGKLNERVGEFTSDRSLPQIRDFVHDGGELIMIGTSTHLAAHLGIPQQDPLVRLVDGTKKSFTKEEYYIPGSVMTVKVNRDAEETSGLGDRVDVYFDNSPVFTFSDSPEQYNVVPLLVFDSAKSLKSGWALGEHYLENTMAAYRAELGKGKLYVFGAEIAFRAQTHSTFKLLFNTLY